MRKLPIGIQSFDKIRRTKDEYYYVDKTPFVERLASRSGYYFLSRPRRFGKSLFLDTLNQAFSAKKEYFTGLYLENNWDWSISYPVIYISFGSGVITDIEDLKLTEDEILKRNSKPYEIELTYPTIKGRFFELIQKLFEKYNKPVVVLIDEYDKPILDRIEDKERAVLIREGLKNFYSVIKDADRYLKFVFITGVTKFSKVSIFSGLNNLQDITLNPEYATICGYTQAELEAVFADRLEGLDMPKIKRWYNGYNWFTGEGPKPYSVYNPFDMLLFLSEKTFRSYWFETGTPSFLIKLLANNEYYIPALENIEAGEELIGSFDIESIYPENLLFQTGYLTIDKTDTSGELIRYYLKYPNLEVRHSLSSYLLNYLAQDVRKKEINRTILFKALEIADFDKLKEVFHSFFASIPSDWYRKNNISGYEGYYASIFYCYFSSSGMFVKAEDSTNQGRIDLTLLFDSKCYIFEFKVLGLSPRGSALKQLKDKKYHEKHISSSSEVYLIGVEFDKDDRNIKGFEWERVK